MEILTKVLYDASNRHWFSFDTLPPSRENAELLKLVLNTAFHFKGYGAPDGSVHAILPYYPIVHHLQKGFKKPARPPQERTRNRSMRTSHQSPDMKHLQGRISQARPRNLSTPSQQSPENNYRRRGMEAGMLFLALVTNLYAMVSPTGVPDLLAIAKAAESNRDDRDDIRRLLQLELHSLLKSAVKHHFNGDNFKWRLVFTAIDEGQTDALSFIFTGA